MYLTTASRSCLGLIIANLWLSCRILGCFFVFKKLDWQHFIWSQIPFKSSLRVLGTFYCFLFSNRRLSSDPQAYICLCYVFVCSIRAHYFSQIWRCIVMRCLRSVQGKGGGFFDGRTNIPTAVQWRLQIITTYFKGIITCCAWPFWQIIHERHFHSPHLHVFHNLY